MSESLTRRKALSVVAAVPVAAALGGVAIATFPKDRLLILIRRYEAGLAIIDLNDDPTNAEIEEWHDRAEAILEEATGLPCLTAASAVAVLGLVVSENMLENSSIFSEHFSAMVGAARDYLVSTMRRAS